jgi:hypothetical protein
VSARWLAVGTTLTGLGGLLAVSWLIFVNQEHESYWQWPGILGLVLAGLGAVGLVVGFFIQDEKAGPRQEQHGSSNSVNLQAGRDITINDGDKGDRS